MTNEIKIIPSKGKLERLGKHSNSDILTLIRKYNFTEKTYFIAYLDFTVILGNIKDKELFYFDKTERKEMKFTEQEISYLQKLRIFNSKEELYIWNSNLSKKEFSARYRNEIDGEKEIEYLEANHVLFGKRIYDLDNKEYSCIRENRGTEIILPFQISKDIVDEKEKRLAIKTRYYIDYNDLGIAQYTDLRFVKFVQLDKKDESSVSEV